MDRQIRIPPTLIEHIRAHDEADEWGNLLTRVGLIRSIEATGDDRAPQTWIHALWGLVEALHQAERARRDVFAPHFSFLRTLGQARWRWAIGLWVMVICIALCGNSFEDRLLVLAWEMLILGLLAMSATLALWFIRVRRQVENMEAMEAAETAIRSHREDLCGGLTSLLSRSFVARLPGSLLICCPHLDWLERRVKDLEGPVGRRSAGDTRIEALEDNLLAALHEVQKALQVHVDDPPGSWTAGGLEPDLEALETRWRELDLPVPFSEARRWAALFERPHSP
ncbi:MAG: hypothetical protein QGG40_12530 [Myxococcota bacterium]|nr:hypothetical protein [Myxococcota bacterium]